jgi:polycystin 2
MGNFYNEWYETTFNNTPELNDYIANENYVLGLARLRQIKVRNDSCVIPKDFRNEIKECFSDYAAVLEEKRPFGPYAAVNNTNKTAWYWRSEKELDGSSHQGLMNLYGGSGYVAILSRNSMETTEIISDLFDKLWIDRGTRAVFLDFTVYNANINLFCQVR